MKISLLSLIIATIAATIAILSYLRDSPVPIVLSTHIDKVPKHGLFSYRASRINSGDSFFFFDSGILVQLKVVNPSSKAINIYDLGVNQKFSSALFSPLLTSNAGNAQKDKLYLALSKNDLEQSKLLSLPLYENADFVVPAYGVIDVKVFFQVSDWNKLNSVSPLSIHWKYAKRRLLWPVMKLFRKDFMKSAEFKFLPSDCFLEKPELLQPEKLLTQSMLDILSSD
ncbi:hypothetical protein [Levilactobacillus andaensis]|uniref:hypothetical protein n=1 Tax=Levilactobacillus andaensis TaxID=2799570 RepID=UPI001941F0D9|nr:hypothetical protein [Levilactobacillus andaensis]